MTEHNQNNSIREEASPLKAGLLCRCPNCEKGKLYQAYLKVNETCPSCGYDLKAIDTDDGPAVFIMFVVGFLVMFAALFVEVSYQPPMWVHMVVWLPAILILSFALLPPFKGFFIASSYKHNAGEGVEEKSTAIGEGDER